MRRTKQGPGEGRRPRRSETKQMRGSRRSPTKQKREGRRDQGRRDQAPRDQGPQGEEARDQPTQSERAVSFEEMRTAKLSFALQPEYKRVAKYLSDLERILLDCKLEEAAPLIDSVAKMFSGRDKEVRHVLQWLEDELDRGDSQLAYQITAELLDGAFRFSPYGMHCSSEYRKRFEREFPEVVRYSAPMEIALTKYASLVVEFHTEGKRKHSPMYQLLMERCRDSDADLTFISFEGGAGEEMRTTWTRVAVPTTHFFDHKAFRIELPRRGECQVDFRGEEEVVFRFEYDAATKKHRKAQKERAGRLKVEG